MGSVGKVSTAAVRGFPLRLHFIHLYLNGDFKNCLDFTTKFNYNKLHSSFEHDPEPWTWHYCTQQGLRIIIEDSNWNSRIFTDIKTR